MRLPSLCHSDTARRYQWYPWHDSNIMASSATQTHLYRQMTGDPSYREFEQAAIDNLIGIRLVKPDEYAPFNTGFIVYRDEHGDYSTNEPIMDGAANLTCLLGALAVGGAP